MKHEGLKGTKDNRLFESIPFVPFVTFVLKLFW